ncbi:MAG: VOC family protein [Methanomassiliicoccus sp.]|nr:VOC family protein [Methanomassiliicoccus sp.]
MMLNPYLNFNGNAEEAFKFYRIVFGGEFSSLMRYKEMPGAERFSEAEGEGIAHIALPVGTTMLMGSDALESVGQKVNFGNSVYVMITPDSEAEARRLFNELSAGGKVEMALEKMFWGDLYASFTDKYGIWWMIDYALPKQG